MCKILIDAGCELNITDSAHKMATHYAKKYGKTETFQYLSSQYQKLKEQKIFVSESRQESANEEKPQKAKRKKDEKLSATSKFTYRLYRSDGFGNANEITENEFDEWIENYPELQEMLKNPD